MDDDPLLTPAIALAATVALIPATVLLASLSALLERSGPIRLRHWIEEAGGRLRGLYDQPRRFEAFRLLLAALVRVLPVLLGLTAGRWLAGYWGAVGWWSAVAGVGVLLVLLEWAIRYLVERHAEVALRALTTLSRIVVAVLGPVLWLLRGLMPTEVTEDDGDDDEASDEEIDAFIDVGRREGILEPEEEELVRSIVDFGDTEVRSVMTPRVEMVSGSADASLEELARVFFDSKHARLPLHRGTVDHVVGILHIRDLFEAIHAERSEGPEALAKAPHYVPESKPLRDLLEELQTLHQQMAIVVDEYGGVAGLVTVEDLVEEIVGEINDEHEATGAFQVRIDEHRWRFAGRTYLEDLATSLELDLDADELPYETVSGLVCGELGYVPKAGDVVRAEGLEITVEEADERRVLSVLIEAHDPARPSRAEGET